MSRFLCKCGGWRRYLSRGVNNLERKTAGAGNGSGALISVLLKYVEQTYPMTRGMTEEEDLWHRPMVELEMPRS